MTMFSETMKSRRLPGLLAVILLSLVPLSPAASASDASSLLLQLLSIAGISAVPSQMRQPDVKPGIIWLAPVERGVPRQLTTDGGYLSPIFALDGRSILALKSDVVVSIPLSGGSPRPLTAVNGVSKIVGFSSLNPLELILLMKRVDAPLVSLSLVDRSLKVLPVDRSSSELQSLVGTIRDQDRDYGTTKVFLRIERKEGLLRPVEWTDVYIATGSSPARNISQCDEVNCVQPALSPDGRTLVFIRSSKES